MTYRWQPPRLSNEVGGYIFLLEEVVELVLEAPLISSRLRADICDPISSSEDSSAPTPARGSLLGNAGVTSERLVMAEDELASPPASVPSSLDRLGLLTPQLKLSTLSPWIWKKKYHEKLNPKWEMSTTLLFSLWSYRSNYHRHDNSDYTNWILFPFSICSQILLNPDIRDYTKTES